MRLRRATDEDWLKRPMTATQGTAIFLLGTVLFMVGFMQDMPAVCAAGGLIMFGASYARFRTQRAERRSGAAKE